MSLKHSLYWPGYETLCFKPHGDGFLIGGLPMIGVTRVVSAGKKDQIADALRRIYTVETYAQLPLIVALVLAITYSVVQLFRAGTVASHIEVLGLIFVPAVPLLGITIVAIVSVVARSVAVRGLLARADRTEARFIREDWLWNWARQIPRPHYIVHNVVGVTGCTVGFYAAVFLIILATTITNKTDALVLRLVASFLVIVVLIHSWRIWKSWRLRNLERPR